MSDDQDTTYSDLGVPIVSTPKLPESYPPWVMGTLAQQMTYEPQGTMWPDPNARPKTLPDVGAPAIPSGPAWPGSQLANRASDVASNVANDVFIPKTPLDVGLQLATGPGSIPFRMGALAAGATLDPSEARADKLGAARTAARTLGEIISPSRVEHIAAPVIHPSQLPSADQINNILTAAREYGRKGWPTAEQEIFKTTPEAYAETTDLVPQVSVKGQLPGPLPGEKLPKFERAQPIVANTDKIAAGIAEDLYPLVREQSPLLKFYHTGPVIRGIERYGDMSVPEASQFMRDWSGQGAATSPRTQTPPNLRNSSFLLYERGRGDPLTPERYAQQGNTPGFPMMGMHVDLADKFARGVENPWTNPKPFTFRENWSGNLRDVTGDTHNIRSTLYKLDQAQPGSIPRGWFSSDDAFAKYQTHGFDAVTPGDIADTLESKTVNKIPRQSEYLPMVEPWYRAANMLGIHPAEGQSGGWFRYGGITGLQSPPKTIVNLLNDQIEASAKAAKTSPEKIVNWWSRGKIPLAGLAISPALGSLAAQDRYSADGT